MPLNVALIVFFSALSLWLSKWITLFSNYLIGTIHRAQQKWVQMRPAVGRTGAVEVVSSVHPWTDHWSQRAWRHKESGDGHGSSPTLLVLYGAIHACILIRAEAESAPQELSVLLVSVCEYLQRYREGKKKELCSICLGRDEDEAKKRTSITVTIVFVDPLRWK